QGLEAVDQVPQFRGVLARTLQLLAQPLGVTPPLLEFPLILADVFGGKGSRSIGAAISAVIATRRAHRATAITLARPRSLATLSLLPLLTFLPLLTLLTLSLLPLLPLL